jgi:hypothetical protein
MRTEGRTGERTDTWLDVQHLVSRLLLSLGVYLAGFLTLTHNLGQWWGCCLPLYR